ncbi:GNAT family N-acetyltransferase [Bacillus sp. FJAT-49736]|uniref:GNAT family N-acetyltransferase n=1 Tax=Bacillus sp. FJAT-49736 TaxID=2833582 RepID=UPI001BC8CF72|nr:GNAT family N-acetyltransferase [Bacillus sp. FJAT-49736]MBS4173033.1 GNAT family N-acetyltransferase [Bacillus sp. FJAT-49736]
MDIKVLKTKVEDAQALLDIQREAFHDDLEKYRDFAGSPAAETMNSLFQKIIFAQHYTIYIKGMIAGSIDIRRISETHYVLNQICLSPSFQNQGYGMKVLKMVEEMYPKAKKWTLKTQKDNVKNRHFYEKAGFILIGEEKLTQQLTLVEYEKTFG